MKEGEEAQDEQKKGQGREMMGRAGFSPLSEIPLVSTPELMTEILEKQSSKVVEAFLDKGIKHFEEEMGICLRQEEDSSNISSDADI